MVDLRMMLLRRDIDNALLKPSAHSATASPEMDLPLDALCRDTPVGGLGKGGGHMERKMVPETLSRHTERACNMRWQEIWSVASWWRHGSSRKKHRANYNDGVLIDPQVKLYFFPVSQKSAMLAAGQELDWLGKIPAQQQDGRKVCTLHINSW